MKKSILTGLMLIALVWNVQAQQQKLYSVFIYSFTKHITWPPSEGDFVVEILGDDVLYDEMLKISKVKKVGSKNMVVKKITSISASQKPDILFVGASQLGQTNGIYSKIGKSTLLITDDGSGKAKSKHINFIVKGGKVTFEIYEADINSTDMKVSPQLKSLGVVM